jgi:predicted component of type VI protein secretion system
MSPPSSFGTRARAWLARRAARGARPNPACDQQALQRAIEQVIDGVEPRLRAVPGYTRRLAPAVAHTLQYFDECGAWLAAPVEFSQRAWSDDPLVRALFATAADLQALFSADPALRRFFHEHPECDWAFVGLGVTRQEQKSLGVALDGEVVRREVPQTVVNFIDYRVFGACASEPELRRNIEQRGFGFLIGEALERIVEQQVHRRGLGETRQLLQMRLKALEQKRNAAGALYEASRALDEEIAQLCERLAQAAPPAETGNGPATLEDYFVPIEAVLAHAEQLVRRETVQLRLNRMNVKVESPDEPGDTLTLSEVTIGRHAPRVVVLGRYPRAELLPERDRLDEAQWLLQR